mmetsp:Transcript_40142/g.74129  ORF Transcript_40142/g.74129 Transcript_40142/m.74129 type:complete len:207 (+) Transcript_40142:907-1527(+)
MEGTATTAAAMSLRETAERALLGCLPGKKARPRRRARSRASRESEDRAASPPRTPRPPRNTQVGRHSSPAHARTPHTHHRQHRRCRRRPRSPLRPRRSRHSKKLSKRRCCCCLRGCLHRFRRRSTPRREGVCRCQRETWMTKSWMEGCLVLFAPSQGALPVHDRTRRRRRRGKRRGMGSMTKKRTTSLLRDAGGGPQTVTRTAKLI